ncbi:MAG: hypothetical protein GTN80_00535 [Nitrososphaeria archaeon]|nr:hypothetical protein [Nitrososphaeria archaeon]NIQ32132.1 hypothetical protein [Nitrososphaeria archaeon]
MGYRKLRAEEIQKIREIKRRGLTNRQIQNRLGYSLSTISKYANHSYYVYPGFTHRLSVGDELVDIRRRISTQESDLSNLGEVEESWIDVDVPISEQKYVEIKLINTIETLKNNNEVKKLEDRIEELEETVNTLTKKLKKGAS